MKAGRPAWIGVVMFSWAWSAGGAWVEGLTTNNNQYWHQDSPGLAGAADHGDQFGWVVASGDFNADGFMDLAIGVPADPVGAAVTAGVVHVLYGGAGGLATNGVQYWTQDDLPLSVSEAGDQFGFSLAAGDFNGDGFDDLAIGVPYEDVGDIRGAGCVHVMNGSAQGLSAVGAKYVQQGLHGLTDAPESDDHFGWALCAGDFNGDGYDDLAVGAPDEDFSGLVNVGVVQVIPGSASGLNRSAGVIWHQNAAGLPTVAAAQDAFGRALSAADYNGDGFADLAVGIPFKDLMGVLNCGSVLIVRGSAAGLTPAGSQHIHQGGVFRGEKAANDLYGYALASGHLDGDAYADLVVGLPFDDGEEFNCGYVHVIYGSAAGLARDQYYHQGAMTNAMGPVAAHDYFGLAVTVGDFNADGCGDLAVGAPLKELTDSPARTNAGAVWILYGTPRSGLNTDGSQVWHQRVAGVRGQAMNEDRFGYALAAGDFDGDGADDLAVGVPFDQPEGFGRQCGAVHAFYGREGLGIWRGSQELVGGWHRSAWFGDFVHLGGGWIWHAQHGYVYSTRIDRFSLYFWTMDMGWFWTSHQVYPYLYRFNDDAWLWYQRPSVGPRWFLNLDTSSWESR